MKVRLSARAIAEIDAAAAYVATDSPRAAAALRKAVEDAIDSLETFPGRGRPGQVEGLRELVVRGAPYVVVYTNSPDEVLVVRVRHTSQGPPT